MHSPLRIEQTYFGVMFALHVYTLPDVSIQCTMHYVIEDESG